ncbi:hypothetical protein EVAR_53299_1 [Eumeta japonica]|uniref:lysozyme n=1 Tax=Eumeta variegata TaxID=151549 RepID=A0A4C1YWF6_EUMVA|nr:hypothetical protein EVAR_53299_1 [Eumeta japonica]
MPIVPTTVDPRLPHMGIKLENFLLASSVMIAVIYMTGSTGVYISNLNAACFHCLCYVSTKCEFSHGCTGGYCGPFNISKVYWVDAGKPVLPDDDPERNHGENAARLARAARH